MENKLKSLTTVIFLVIFLLCSRSTQAADKTWIGPDNGWWTTSNNWSPSGLPAPGDNVYLTTSNSASTTINYYNTTYTGPSDSFNNIRIDNTGGGNTTLLMGSLYPHPLVANFEYIGYNGTGIIEQQTGTNRINSFLCLGYEIGSNGTYSLINGDLVAEGEYLGLAGTGNFIQSGGTHTVNNTLLMGITGPITGNIGNYFLSNGDLVVGYEYLGDVGPGNFIQSGGTHSVNSDLIMGYDFYSEGNYSLTNGDLEANKEIMGFYGSGNFFQSGGTHTVGDLYLGYQVDSSGTYEQSGGTLLVNGNLFISRLSATGGTYSLSNNGNLEVNHDEYIGEWGADSSFFQSGGTHTVANELFLGFEHTSSGTYSLTNGDLMAYRETLGFSGNGNFIQSGGTHTVATELCLGVTTGSSGTYSLSNGNLVAGNELLGAEGGTGNFFQSGGTHTINNDLYLGFSPGGNGTYSLNNGTLQIDRNEFIGYTGTGTFIQTGGTHTVADTISIRNGSLMEVQDGRLSAGTIQNNGTLEFLNGDMDVSGNIYNGDGIDTGQLNITNNIVTFHNQVTNNINSHLKATDAEVHFTGGYSGNGVLSVDPSDLYFSNLIIGIDGYIIAGAGNNFFISGDFLNESIQSALWKTGDAYLAFSGSGTHEFSLAGYDYGAVGSGYQDNFAWGIFYMDSGSSLNLLDGNEIAGGALYVDAFILEGGIGQISSITGDGYNIYYNPFNPANDYLLGETYALTGGGSLVPTPEPLGTLLYALGLLGMALLSKKRKKS